jgi:bacterial/archaeal transporter family protein
MKSWILYAIISMFFAGLTSVIAKLGMKNVPSDVALFVRTMFVSCFVVINMVVFHQLKSTRELTRTDIMFLAISGLTTSLSWIFYYKAIKVGDVSVVATIDKASVLITIMLAFFFLKEPLTPKLLLGAALILAGAIVLIWK